MHPDAAPPRHDDDAADPAGPAAARARRALHLVAARLAPAVGIVLFGLALWVLHGLLREHPYRELAGALAALGGWQVAAALGLMAAGYLSSIGYDLLALRFVGATVPSKDAAAAALLSGALGNNIGNTLLTGGAVRYWIYTAAGLPGRRIVAVVLFCSVGFWLGYLTLGAIAFLAAPLELPASLHLGAASTRPVGAAFLAALCLWLALCARGRPLGWGAWRMAPPAPALALGQVAVGTADLGLMAGALYVLLPQAQDIGFVAFLPAFLIALVAGTASQVPGGLGVFEAALLLLLSHRVDAGPLAASMLAFRGIYLVLPLLLAAAFIGARGLGRGGRARTVPTLPDAPRAASPATRAPPVLAATTFLSGAVLLASGALPAGIGRLELVQRLFALPVIEASHFAASLLGAMLLIVAHGLHRRLDAAWLLAVSLLGAGAVLSLVKGWDYEEATLLAVAALALLPVRGQFHRTSSLLDAPFEPAWIVAIAIVLAGAAWLVQFAHGHGEVAASTWWQFAWSSEGPRSLRATVGAIALLVMLALHRLLRPAPPAPPAVAQDELERARPIVERSASTYANLVYRGDKTLLFSDAGDAFLMYGRHGRSWIAMGDPVGEADAAAGLAWRFLELADRNDGRCVFFEVHDARRGLYAELGLTLTPIGEEARVDLQAFDLDSAHHAGLRQSRAKLQRRGWRFEILAREAVPAVLPELRRISQSWLSGKATREKGFSNASFDEAYLRRFPVAVVRQGEQVVAFANVWYGAGREELSVDLMRHVPEAPNGTMDFLFAELLLHGRGEGFRWFNFGVAPLAELETHADRAMWRRIGAFVYRHAEHFYNFEGLRRYKAKYHPVWTPVYVASPGGLALAPVLIDVAALIAGGLGGVVLKGGAALGRRAGGGRHEGADAKAQP
jgi:phosphatidylglycerol lysyltransferase